MAIGCFVCFATHTYAYAYTHSNNMEQPSKRAHSSANTFRIQHTRAHTQTHTQREWVLCCVVLCAGFVGGGKAFYRDLLTYFASRSDFIIKWAGQWCKQNKKINIYTYNTLNVCASARTFIVDDTVVCSTYMSRITIFIHIHTVHTQPNMQLNIAFAHKLIKWYRNM